MNLNEFDGIKVATMLSMMVSRDSNLKISQYFADEDDESINEFRKTMSFSDLYRTKQIYLAHIERIENAL